MLKLSLSLFIGLFLSLQTFAATRDKVTMEDSITVAGKTLLLNGMTTRMASKMGVTVKVYVGGLYLEAKESNGPKIVASDTMKRIVMHYIFFRAPGKKIKQGWKDSFKANCGDEATCKAQKANLKIFNKQVKTMTKNDKMILDFYKDKLEVTLEKKKKTTKVTIADRKFADIILKAFVQAKTKAFRGPLGID